MNELTLWFFRDLSEYQRMTLLSLWFYPAIKKDDDPLPLHQQRLWFKRGLSESRLYLSAEESKGP